MMKPVTAEKLAAACWALRHWQGSITRQTYTTLAADFGVKDKLPCWDTFKKYMQAAHLLQRANGCTRRHSVVMVDYDEGVEHWSSYESSFYRFNRRRPLITTAEGWRKVAA